MWVKNLLRERKVGEISLASDGYSIVLQAQPCLLVERVP